MTGHLKLVPPAPVPDRAAAATLADTAAGMARELARALRDGTDGLELMLAARDQIRASVTLTNAMTGILDGEPPRRQTPSEQTTPSGA